MRKSKLAMVCASMLLLGALAACQDNSANPENMDSSADAETNTENMAAGTNTANDQNEIDAAEGPVEGAGGEENTAAGGEGVIQNTDETEEVQGDAGADSAAPSGSTEAAVEIIRDSGVYVGQIDVNSVEIQTDKGSQAFQLEEGVSAQLDQLNPDDQVTFEYYEHTLEGEEGLTQLMLTQIAQSE